MNRALWALGFRPFFLFAAIAAAVIMGLWLAIYSGNIASPPYFASPFAWHAHEMLFGFAVAVVVGFLLTASKNWTGMQGVSGWRLVVLVCIWALGRLMSWAHVVPPPVYAGVDLAFLPSAAFLLSPYLTRQDQRRNLGLLILLLVLTLANALVHADALGFTPGTSRRGNLLALDTIVLIQTVIAGRVLPMFTRNTLPEARVHTRPTLDKAAIGITVLFLVCDFWNEAGLITYLAAGAAAVIHGVRLGSWDVWATRRSPMLWILMTGYGWLVIGFLLKASMALAPLPPGIALHAFAVGGIGCMTYGFMPRVSLGHTGRAIVASPLLVTGFVLINLSTFVRVVVAALEPSYYAQAIIGAGLLWTIAFGLFVALFRKVLCSPRADGRVG